MRAASEEPIKMKALECQPEGRLACRACGNGDRSGGRSFSSVLLLVHPSETYEKGQHRHVQRQIRGKCASQLSVPGLEKSSLSSLDGSKAGRRETPWRLRIGEDGDKKTKGRSVAVICMGHLTSPNLQTSFIQR